MVCKNHNLEAFLSKPACKKSRRCCSQRAKHPRGLKRWTCFPLVPMLFATLHRSTTFTTNWPLVAIVNLFMSPTWISNLEAIFGAAVTVILFHHTAESCHPWHVHETGISVLACFNPAKLPTLWRCFAWGSQRKRIEQIEVEVDHETRCKCKMLFRID